MMYIMERRATVHWVQSIPSIGKAMPWRDNGITMERQFPSMIILTITTEFHPNSNWYSFASEKFDKTIRSEFAKTRKTLKL